jgi:hypothetical protein
MYDGNIIIQQILIALVILTILALIIVVIIYASTNTKNSNNTNNSIGSICSSNTDCPGLTCNNGLCKIPIGGNCVANPNSCSSGSSCIDSVCQSNELRVVQVSAPQPVMLQNIPYSLNKLAYPKNFMPKVKLKSDLPTCEDLVTEESDCDCEDQSIETQSPMQNQSYQSPMQNQSYQPPMQNQSYQPPMQNQSYQPPMQNQSYHPPMQNQSYQPPMQNQSYQPPMQNQAYQPPMQNQNSQLQGYNSATQSQSFNSQQLPKTMEEAIQYGKIMQQNQGLQSMNSTIYQGPRI